MHRGNCYGDPATWGAGEGRADLTAARNGCRTCPLLDGCIDRFASSPKVRPDLESLAGLVVGGLYGRDLVAAVRRVKRGRAA